MNTDKLMESLDKHFYEKIGKASKLIGLPVQTIDGEHYFINDFDQMCDSHKLPAWLFVSRKRGSNFGKLIKSSKLFIPELQPENKAKEKTSEDIMQDIFTQVEVMTALNNIMLNALKQIANDFEDNEAGDLTKCR